MKDYKVLYEKLFDAIADTINSLIAVQVEIEELYLEILENKTIEEKKNNKKE